MGAAHRALPDAQDSLLLLISGGFALAVEGQLPPEPGHLHILPGWFNVSSASNGTVAGDGGLVVEVAAFHYVLPRAASASRCAP